MASRQSPQPEFTDCPLCRSLCLSPTILPCGHLVCRKCLRHILETQGPNPACPSCKRRIPRAQGQTISELADQLGKELVLEGLVIEKLGKQKNVTCVSCEKSATKLCLDCAETYCNSCSSAHKAMSMSKDHLQHDLPQTAQGQQSAARSHQTPRQDAGGDSGSQSSAERLRDSKESPGSQSQENLERDFLKMEAELCQESVTKLKDAAAVVEANMAQLQEVKKKLEAQQQLLTTYVTRLAKPDDALLSNARSMLPRLRFVRADCRPPQDAALNTMTKHINSLLHTNDVSGN
ncbi:hypothetical protein BaRGS_00008440 [Batillaria attramentaria]|uniref:RING-type domain-containing protein n=1 Tax=Batillaria attramentaria TaxID=370345 RepID=A0ABD0LMI3_9CAEN